MTIERIQEERRMLEEQIKQVLNDFENKTFLSINKIDLIHEIRRSIKDNREVKIISVKIEVKL